mgnify:CR=1 FL=1
MEITEEQILKIVDKCFHSYASSFRNEAKQEAITLINKHKEAINYTRCCTELPTKEDLSSLISKVTPVMEEEGYEPEQILKCFCAFKDGFRYGQKPKK